MTADELVTVFATRDVLEADMVRLELQEEGIDARIDNEHQGGLTGVLEAKVYVMSSDVERAKQVISNLEQVVTEPYRLVVISFEDEGAADRVQVALQQLEQSYLIDIKDSVVLVKNKSGELSVKQTYHLTRDGALIGGMLGALLGAMFMSPGLGFVAGAATGAAAGALTDIGIDDQFLKDVGQKLQSMNSALVVLVRRADPEKVLTELDKYEGSMLHTTLSHADEERLRAALKGEAEA